MELIRTIPMAREEFLQTKQKLNRSIEEIAGYLGVSVRTVYSWSNGKEKMTLLGSLAMDQLKSCELPAAVKSTRRPRQNYYEMGLRDGDRITFVDDESLIITVAGKSELEFEGERMSLTRLANHLSEVREQKVSRNDSFAAKGKTLKELYDETYGAA